MARPMANVGTRVSMGWPDRLSGTSGKLSGDGQPQSGHAIHRRTLIPTAWRSLSQVIRRTVSPRATEGGDDVSATTADGRGGAGPASLTFDQFLTELAALDLADRYFTWSEYRERLAARLEVPIHIRFVEDPLERMALLDHDPGRLYRDEVSGEALILVVSGLNDFAELDVIYHELGHIAGGHPLPIRQAVRGVENGEVVLNGAAGRRLGEGRAFEESGIWWVPPTRLAARPAPKDEPYCEQDARLRAEYAVLASHYGVEHGARDEAFFRLDWPKWRPRREPSLEGDANDHGVED